MRLTKAHFCFLHYGGWWDSPGHNIMITEPQNTNLPAGEGDEGKGRTKGSCKKPIHGVWQKCQSPLGAPLSHWAKRPCALWETPHLDPGLSPFYQQQETGSLQLTAAHSRTHAIYKVTEHIVYFPHPGPTWDPGKLTSSAELLTAHHHEDIPSNQLRPLAQGGRQAGIIKKAQTKSKDKNRF